MRQIAISPIFYMLPDEPKMKTLFSSVPKENLRPVWRTQWTIHVKPNIYQQIKQNIMDLD